MANGTKPAISIQILPSKFRTGTKDDEGNPVKADAFVARLIAGKAYVNLSEPRINMLERTGTKPEIVNVMRAKLAEAEALTLKTSPGLAVKPARANAAAVDVVKLSV